MPGNGWKWLEMTEKGNNGVENGQTSQKWLKMLEMLGNSQKWLKHIVGNDKKMAGNGWKVLE